MLPLEEVFGDRLNVTVLRLLSQLAGRLSGNAIARRLGLQQSAVPKPLADETRRGARRYLPPLPPLPAGARPVRPSAERSDGTRALPAERGHVAPERLM